MVPGRAAVVMSFLLDLLPFSAVLRLMALIRELFPAFWAPTCYRNVIPERGFIAPISLAYTGVLTYVSTSITGEQCHLSFRFRQDLQYGLHSSQCSTWLRASQEME